MAATAWIVLPYYSWRFLTVVTAVPVLVTCLISTQLLPESPRWLCVHRRQEEAQDVLAAASLVNGTCTALYLEEHPILLHVPEDGEAEGIWVQLKELLSPQNYAVTLPLWVVWACFGAAYYGILLFTGEMFSSDTDDDAANDDGGQTCSFDYGPFFITAVAEFVACVLIVRFVDSQGRVRSQSVGYGAGAIGCILMGECCDSVLLCFFSGIKCVCWCVK